MTWTIITFECGKVQRFIGRLDDTTLSFLEAYHGARGEEILDVEITEVLPELIRYATAA